MRMNVGSPKDGIRWPEEEGYPRYRVRSPKRKGYPKRDKIVLDYPERGKIA
jgi:hypothetical protein